MKNELKLEFNANRTLNNLIQKSYFKGGQKGRLHGKNNYIEIDPKKDKVTHTVLKGLKDVVIKIYNSELIEGNCKFIIDETRRKIRLYPISLFCITTENGKYSFY